MFGKLMFMLCDGFLNQNVFLCWWKSESIEFENMFDHLFWESSFRYSGLYIYYSKNNPFMKLLGSGGCPGTGELWKNQTVIERDYRYLELFWNKEQDGQRDFTPRNNMNALHDNKL